MTDTSPLVVDGFDITTRPDIEIAAKFFRGLADPIRLQIVALLLGRGEMSVGDIVDAVDGLPVAECRATWPAFGTADWPGTVRSKTPPGVTPPTKMEAL